MLVTAPLSAAAPPIPVHFDSVAELLGTGGGLGARQGLHVSVGGRVFDAGADGGLLLTDPGNIRASALVDAHAAIPLLGKVDGLRPGQDVALLGVLDIRKRLDGRTTVLSVTG